MLLRHAESLLSALIHILGLVWCGFFLSPEDGSFKRSLVPFRPSEHAEGDLYMQVNEKDGRVLSVLCYIVWVCLKMGTLNII